MLLSRDGRSTCKVPVSIGSANPHVAQQGWQIHLQSPSIYWICQPSCCSAGMADPLAKSQYLLDLPTLMLLSREGRSTCKVPVSIGSANPHVAQQGWQIHLQSPSVYWICKPSCCSAEKADPLA